MNQFTMRAMLSVAMVVWLSACVTRPPRQSYVTLLENPDGSTGQVVVKGSRGEQVIDKAYYAAPLDGSSSAAPVDAEMFKRDFAGAMAARPQLPEQFMLYFESGGVQLTAESQALLPTIIEHAGKRPTVDVSIIGHTDTVGKAEENEALALKRAQAIADLIKNKGLKVDAMSIESHGERNLLVATPDETPEPSNRRVEISIR